MTEYIDGITDYFMRNPVAIFVASILVLLVAWIIVKQIKFIVCGCIILLLIGGYFFYKHGCIDRKYSTHFPEINLKNVKEKSDSFRQHTKKEILETLTE